MAGWFIGWRPGIASSIGAPRRNKVVTRRGARTNAHPRAPSPGQPAPSVMPAERVRRMLLCSQSSVTGAAVRIDGYGSIALATRPIIRPPSRSRPDHFCAECASRPHSLADVDDLNPGAPRSSVSLRWSRSVAPCPPMARRPMRRWAPARRSRKSSTSWSVSFPSSGFRASLRRPPNSPWRWGTTLTMSSSGPR